MTEGQPNPISILDRLRMLNKNEGLAILAVEHLHTEEDMSAFLVEYADHLRTTSDIPLARKNPAQFAAMEIFKATNKDGYDYDTFRRWDQLIRNGVVRPADRGFEYFKNHK